MLQFDPISSPGGTRDVFVDFTRALEESETISGIEVVSSDTKRLTIAGEAVNTAEINQDGITVAIGKGVGFSVTTVVETVSRVAIIMKITGDSGTVEKWKFSQPIIKELED